MAHTTVGSVLRNLGCEAKTDRTWYHVGYLDASGLEGWAAAENLAPATATRRAGAELLDEIGRLECRYGTAVGAGPGKRWAGEETCNFGVAREADGSGSILIYLADNRRLLLDFGDGTFTAAAGVTDTVTDVETVADGVRVSVPDVTVDIPSRAFRTE